MTRWKFDIHRQGEQYIVIPYEYKELSDAYFWTTDKINFDSFSEAWEYTKDHGELIIEEYPEVVCQKLG